MKQSKITITVLSFLLVGSNLVWMYLWMNSMSTIKYNQLSLIQEREKLSQALTMLPIVAKFDSTEAQVIDAASKGAERTYDCFEKEGFICIGHISIRFDESGRLIEAK